MLLCFVRALVRDGLLSCRSALCQSTSVWVFLEVSSVPHSSLLLPLQHSCRLFSLHGNITKFVSGCHNVVNGSPGFFLSNFVFPCFPRIHLSIFISVVCIICCSALCSAKHSLPYIKVGLMTVLYSLLFNFNKRDLLIVYYST